MKPALRLRLITLESAIFAVVVLLCWVGYEALSVGFHREIASAKKLDRLLSEFAVYQVQYYEIADHIGSDVGHLDEILLRFVVQNDPAEWAMFQRDGQRLAQWISTQKATAPAGKTIDIVPSLGIAVDFASLLEEIDKTYARYLEAARQVPGAPEKPVSSTQRLKALEVARSESQKLLTLAGRTRAFGESVNLIALSKPTFPWETVWIPALLLGLVVVCGWLAVVVYRREVREANEMHQQLTESRLQNEQQEMLAQKGQTAAELAHELRNPLTAINFRLHTLQKSLATRPDEHQDAAVIRKEVRRLNAILEDFLQLDQPPQPSFVRMSAEAALREVRDLMAPQLEAQAIQVKLEAHEDPEFEADPHLLQQVLINLIKNAAESIHGHGTIVLRTRRTTAELRRHQTEVVIFEVQDSGTGIPPEVRDRLYDAFFTTKKGGTGLGLSIVERIVEKHRGVLDFDTKLGEGTTFRITLPVEQYQ